MGISLKVKYNFCPPSQAAARKPITNIRVPREPKICTVHEADGDQVKIPNDEPFYPVLGHSILSLLVLNHLFAYVDISGLFGQEGDITVHIPVDLNVFDDFLPVGFQSTVKIMKFDPRDPACKPVV